ncbi:hypothetical protein BKY29_03030 [Weissella confusa]|uniref:hypothetical protein n=1 Tax=Weissella confusa TaxID=1583 RepID=UPI0008FE5979|nr:hypothetical protein [Weissella confusa]OJF03992.1 hypothetical protein BKY29_03030 [Weissella confusa]
MSASTPMYQVISYLNDLDGSYVSLFAPDAIVSDVASKQISIGLPDIQSYFKQYFFAHNVQTSIHSVEPLNDEVLAHVTFHGGFSDSFASDGNVDATIELATTGHKIHKMIIKLDAA